MYNNKRIIQYFMNERNQTCWICAITVTLYVQSLPGRKEKDFSPCRLFPFLRRGLCKRNKSLSQAKLMVGRRRHSTGPDKFNEMKSGAWHTREREREREKLADKLLHHPQSLDQMRENLSVKIMSGGPHAK